MSGAVSVGPKAALGPAATRLRQVALVTKDMERAKQLLVRFAWACATLL
jgi:hypothetical protein